MTWASFLQSAAIGIVSGILAALCGVGGGIVMVPVFVLLMGLDQKHAVATSLVAIVVTSISASVRNHGNMLIDWHVALPVGLFAAISAWFAADWMRNLDNSTLSRGFAVLMILVGLRMLFVK